jgi:hypothetical protein
MSITVNIIESMHQNYNHMAAWSQVIKCDLFPPYHYNATNDQW